MLICINLYYINIYIKLRFWEIGIRGSGDPYFLSPRPSIPYSPPPPLRGAMSSRSLLRKFLVLEFLRIDTVALLVDLSTPESLELSSGRERLCLLTFIFVIIALRKRSNRVASSTVVSLGERNGEVYFGYLLL